MDPKLSDKNPSLRPKTLHGKQKKNIFQVWKNGSKRSMGRMI
jgi:hypothetical protein